MTTIIRNKMIILFYLINTLSLDIVALNISNIEKEIIENYISFMAKSIDKSLSGKIHKIKRMDGKDYEFDENIDMKNYTSIFKHIDKNKYEEAYNIIFENKIADCYEQSFYVGMMLKNTKKIDDKFQLFIMNLLWEDDNDDNISHVFLIMFPKNTNIKEVSLEEIFYFDSNNSRNNLPPDMTEKLKNLEPSTLLFNENVIIIDTWQQRIFGSMSINLDNNPISYSCKQSEITNKDDFNYKIDGFTIHNMDIAFHGFKNFNEFHEKISLKF